MFHAILRSRGLFYANYTVFWANLHLFTANLSHSRAVLTYFILFTASTTNSRTIFMLTYPVYP